MKGPGIFLAQFAGDKPPFNSLEGMAQWAASLGYVGVQVPTSDPQLVRYQIGCWQPDLLRRDQGQAR